MRRKSRRNQPPIALLFAVEPAVAQTAKPSQQSRRGLLGKLKSAGWAVAAVKGNHKKPIEAKKPPADPTHLRSGKEADLSIASPFSDDGSSRSKRDFVAWLL